MKKFSKLETTGPQPSVRSSPAIASLGHHIYLFGGVKDDFSTKVNTFYNDLYRLNTQTNVWEKLSPSGSQIEPRAFAVAVADKISNKIFIFGGANYTPDFSRITTYNDLWAYSPNENTFNLLNPVNKGPSSRSKPTMWLVDNERIYIFGGAVESWNLVNDLWMYDLRSNSWSELISNNMPNSPSVRHEALGGFSSSSSDKLVIYGGEAFFDATKQRFTTLTDTWEFNLKTNQWKDVTPSPENNLLPPRNFACAVAIDNNMYVQGGAMGGVGSIPVAECGAPFPQRGVSDELWHFDQTQYVWKKLAVAGDPLPRLKRNVATACEGKMYIFSGWDFQWYGTGPGQIWNPHVYSYDPSP